MNKGAYLSCAGPLVCMAVAMVICGGLSGCGVDGWNTADPTTVLRFEPASKSVYFADSKDNDVSIIGLEYKGDTKSFKADDIKIINNASKVREANAIQLQQLALQTQAIMVGLQNMANSLASIFPTAKAAPAVVPTFPVATAEPAPTTAQAP